MPKSPWATLGWSIVGSLAGMLLFPKKSQQKPDDLAGMKVSGPTPGSPLPIMLGGSKCRGHRIWVGPITTHPGSTGKKGTTSGKKGGGETTFSRSFMDAIIEGDPDGNITLRQILSGDDVLYDSADPSKQAASGIDFTFYPGKQDDPIDPRMAAYQLGGTSTQQTFTETASIGAGGGTYTALHLPIVSGTDVVWYQKAGGQIVYLARVGASPGVDQYTINLTTGLFTVGGLQEAAVVTFRYDALTGTATQEPLAYPNVCKIYVHEFDMGATQTLAQLNYVVCRDLPAFSPDGVVERLVVGSAEATFTADSGATWAASTGEGGGYLGQGKDAGVVWCGGVPANTKLLKSTDKGATFSPIGNPVHSVRSVKRALAQLAGGRIVVGLTIEAAPHDTLAIAYSDDNALTWTVVNVDPTFPGFLDATGINIRPHSLWAVNATTLLFLARINDGLDREQIFRSTDSALTWAKVGPVITFASGQFMDHLWVDPSTGFIFASGPSLFRSTDAGATWSIVAAGNTSDINFPHRSAIARNAIGELLWIVGGATGFKSVNDGATWITYTTPPTVSGNVARGLYRMKDALIQSRDDGSSNLAWRSTDNGLTWATMAGMVGAFVDFVSPLGAPAQPDCDWNFIDIMEHLITDPRYGGGRPKSILLDTVKAASWQYLFDNDLRGSVLIEARGSLLGVLEEIMTHYFGWLALVQGKLLLGVRRPETVTREIVLDDALVGGELAFNLSGERDTKNRIRVDFTNRARLYNTSPVYVADDFDRSLRGERLESISLPHFRRESPAKATAAKYLALRRYPILGFEVTLGPKELAMAAGDVYAVTSVKLGLSQEPCRVVAVGESEERGKYAVQLVAEPAASLALRTFPVEPGNPGDAPGSPTAPAGPTLLVVWEVPPELSGEGVFRTMFVGAGAGSPEWRGFSIYLSLDGGLSYDRVATHLGAGASIGSLETYLPADDGAWEDLLAVDVNVGASKGALAAVTRNQALALTSLAIVGTGNEPIAFRAADLLAANRYRLRGLLRGPFERGRAAHGVSARFALVGALPDFPTLDHPASRIGQALFFKAVGVNRYGIEGDIAAAAGIPFTLAGIARAPSPVRGLQLREGVVLQGSKAVIGTGSVDVGVGWRYARRDNPEDADLVDGAEVAAKEPLWQDYQVRIYTKAIVGGTYGLRRTISATAENHTYTSAQNVADNGAYHPFVKFEVSARRSTGVESLKQAVEIQVAQ